MEKYYKYRSVNNLKYVLDILINKRLYASSYENLNDPMEGYFLYKRGLFDNDQLKQIRGEKARYKILSLTKSSTDLLMWSYYAEGHKGVVIGVNINDQRLIIENVNYVDELKIREENSDIAKYILTRKLRSWAHEREYRILTDGEEYVNVKITDIIFGTQTDEHTEDLLTKIAKKFCPNVSIKKLTRRDLETGQSYIED